MKKHCDTKNKVITIIYNKTNTRIHCTTIFPFVLPNRKRNRKRNDEN